MHCEYPIRNGVCACTDRNNLVPETAQPAESGSLCSDLVGTGTILTSAEHGGVVVQWEAEPELRYVKRYQQITRYRPDWGDTVSVGQTEHLILQQLWRERLNGGVEWRDVPLVDREVPTDEAHPLRAESAQPKH